MKICWKEKRDRETTIGQIAGELRQNAKINPSYDQDYLRPFVEDLYDTLYVKTWQKSFPRPIRLRNWINEFGFWYSQETNVDRLKGYEQSRIAKVKKAIEQLESEGKNISEDEVIALLKTSDANKNKAIDLHEVDYRTAFKAI